MSEIQIVECVRCQAPQVFDNRPEHCVIPVALQVNLDGGDQMFVDNWLDSPAFNLVLCHECGHELTKWLGIPDKTVKNWHPKTEDSFCDGWTIEEIQEKYNG